MAESRGGVTGGQPTVELPDGRVTVWRYRKTAGTGDAGCDGVTVWHYRKTAGIGVARWQSDGVALPEDSRQWSCQMAE